LDEADKHFQAGYDAAWQACGEPPQIDHAAREFGRGIGDLLNLVLQAAVAWVLKKGLEAGLKELNESAAGRALAPFAKIQYWRNKLGVTDAKIPRLGIAKTIEFFEDQVRQGRLESGPGKFTDEANLLSYWKAMDFSKEIKPGTLPVDKILVGFRDPNFPFGYYYTEPGSFLDKAGIDYVMEEKLPAGVSGPKQLIPRKFVRFRVRNPAPALKSTCSGFKDLVTKNPASGGATQYFIPRASEVLEVVPNPPSPGVKPPPPKGSP
jgi:hypothetical protein